MTLRVCILDLDQFAPGLRYFKSATRRVVLTASIVAPITSATGQILAAVIERWRTAAGQRDIATIAGFDTEEAQLFLPNSAPSKDARRRLRCGVACFL